MDQFVQDAGEPAPMWPAPTPASGASESSGRTDRPVPRGPAEELTVDGEAEPVVVKLGVWVSNTKTRRSKLDAAQLAALAELGVDWAR
ncbi:hypothetical protein [Streptomyces sp. H27-H1]|uniref:hypothetical protein n=1 Tax=Streptomyces sp. H27-H1 TaxID=2996461 RepID=UPI003B63DF0F